jgi:hypothetical protein
MLTEIQIFEAFRKFSVLPRNQGEEYYLTLGKGFEFINLCSANDYSIIGIEAFEFDGKRLFPRGDLIADYTMAESKPWEPESWDSFQSSCNNSAKNFLTHVEKTNPNKNMVISFVIFSRAEWNNKKSPQDWASYREVR